MGRKVGELSERLRRTLSRPVSGKKPAPGRRPGSGWNQKKPTGKGASYGKDFSYWAAPAWMKKLTGKKR